MTDMSIAHLERIALNDLEVQLRAKGYDVVREPAPAGTPSFLGQHRPDAIAIGRKPYLVIEILRGRDPSGASHMIELRRLIEQEPDWKLKLAYVEAPIEETVDRLSLNILTTQSNEAASLAQYHPKAALLMYWGTLEGLLRYREPKLGERLRSSRFVADALFAQDYVSKLESEELTRLAAMRNRIAHGAGSETPSASDFQLLSNVAERLQDDREIIAAE